MDGGVIVEQGDVVDVFFYLQYLIICCFVFEVEWVDEDECYDDFVYVLGFILCLIFCGEVIYVLLLGIVVWQIGVDYSIFFGCIDCIKDMFYGQLILVLVGGDLEVVMSQLNVVDVYVEVLC